LLYSQIREKVNTDMRKSLLYHENARRIKEEEEEPYCSLRFLINFHIVPNIYLNTINQEI
jgi:hypothetical protein